MQSLISRLNPERKQNINRAILMHPSLRMLLFLRGPPPQIDKRPFIEYFLGLNQVNDGYISSFKDLCTMVQITGNITYHE